MKRADPDGEGLAPPRSAGVRGDGLSGSVSTGPGRVKRRASQ